MSATYQKVKAKVNGVEYPTVADIALMDGQGRNLYTTIPTQVSFDESSRKLTIKNAAGTEVSSATIPDYSLTVATSSALGGVKIGYSESGKNYAVQLDSNNKMFVTVPWTDTTYTLPTMSSSTKGGAKVGNGLTIASETLAVKYDDSTIKFDSTKGLYATGFATASDITTAINNLPTADGTTIKLDASHNTYYVNTASDSNIGGVKLAYTNSGKNYKLQVDSSGNAYTNVPWVEYSNATQSAAGLMSAADKTKLDGISAGSSYTVTLSGSVTSIGGTKIPEGGTLDVIYLIPSAYYDGLTYYYYYEGEYSLSNISVTNATKVILNKVDNTCILKVTNPQGNVTVNTGVTKKSKTVGKGDLITMNLGNTASAYGTLHEYRILRVISGSIVEVVAMYEPTTSQAFSSSNNTYSGSSLDTYLNTTFYNTLSSEAKAAIVANNINQYQYPSGSISDSHRSYATYTSKTLKANVGSRYIYALDVEDIEMYFGGTGGSASDKTAGTFTLAQLMTLFYKSTATISGKYFWLRSAYASNTSYAWNVNGYNGYVYYYGISSTYAVRPAFKIDLLKIDWSISN